ncbi:MAG: hypothetical protein R3B99_12650 [Polyangiales bacterium]
MGLPAIPCRDDILAASVTIEEVAARSRVRQELLQDRDLLASLVLTHFPERVSAPALEAYFARLYYFARFVARSEEDPALEDELMRILSEAPDDVDWACVESILYAARSE